MQNFQNIEELARRTAALLFQSGSGVRRLPLDLWSSRAHPPGFDPENRKLLLLPVQVFSGTYKNNFRTLEYELGFPRQNCLDSPSPSVWPHLGTGVLEGDLPAKGRQWSLDYMTCQFVGTIEKYGSKDF
jgi:hypothetical protein